MKKGLKAILWIAGALALTVLIFWISINYVTNYKKTDCDKSISPDGKYELTLQAVGEADWPFGSASGQLVLREGKDKISRTKFELQNDGKSINSSCWEVTWYEDYVEVILSGEEQFDDQVILYFDGRKEIQQLTDTADASEPEYQARPEDYDSMEYINKYMISEQSFDVFLDDWGEVTFVSCKPSPDEAFWKDASFYLIRDEQVLYKFPYRFENNSTQGFTRLFDSVGAVAFRDINNDQKDDIIIIINYVTGAGPQGMLPRPEARIFIAEDNGFALAEDLMSEIEANIVEKERSIQNICEYIENNNMHGYKYEQKFSEEIDLLEADLQKYSADWQESQIINELKKRRPYSDNCSFYPEYLQYMENVREVRDISMYLEPLYATDTEYYVTSDFDDVPPLIIYLAKNEIYARHGYIFKDMELNAYFLNQLWYLPEFDPENFDTSVFNEYETANLQLLAQLDTYK